MNSHLPSFSYKHPTASSILNYITYFMILMKVTTLFGTGVHTQSIILYAKYRWKFGPLVLKFLPPTSFIDFVSVLGRPFICLLHKWHHRSCKFWARCVCQATTIGNAAYYKFTSAKTLILH